MKLIGLFSLLLVLGSGLQTASAQFKPGATPEYKSTETPQDFSGMGIEEKLGTQLDMNWQFTNEEGKLVKLSDVVSGKKPILLSLIYYSCPGLCNFHLNGVTEALKELDWSVGDKFDVVVVSFDHSESYKTGAGKKDSYIEMYERQGTEKGWHFLTGDEANVKALTQAVGFSFKWNEKSGEWAHASAAILVTPQGKVARYLHGIMFDAKTLKLALQEATEGKIGTFVERMVFYCFKYDPQQSKYTLAAFRLVQAGALLIIIALAGILIPYWRSNVRSRKK